MDIFECICGDMGMAIIVAVILILCVSYYTKNKDLPPGPVSFPIFGYSLILKDESCVEKLEKLQKKYGDIFSFTFAGTLYINLGSMKALKEFHLAHADSFQRSNDFSVMSCFFQDGIFFVNGEHWKVLRKFTLQQLREYGMTSIKDNMSLPLLDSVKETISYLKSKKGEPVEIVQYLTDKCNTILRCTMFGERGITEQQVKELNDSFIHMVVFITNTNLLYSGSLSRFLLPLKSGYWTAMKSLKVMLRALNEIVEDHKANFRADDHPSNFIDAYLKERHERNTRGDPTAKFFSDKALVATLKQFVGDGVLSVAIFIAMFMTRIEEHQDKIYAEIVDVVGLDRAPTMEDKGKLPYTNAYIHEIIRTSKFFSLFPSQQCIKETIIRGYRIPKGALTLMNLWTCHHDPAIYHEPEKFNPSRFMVEDKSKRPDLPVIFGIGRRTCLGEGYVMAQVFLFLTTIIQNFKLSIEAYKADSFDFSVSESFKIRAIPRNEGN